MQHGISMESALHLLQVQTSITQLWWGLLSTLVVILPSDISLCERHHRYPLAAATAKSNHACEFSDHNAHRVAFLSRRPMLSLQSLGICNNVSAASHLIDTCAYCYVHEITGNYQRFLECWRLLEMTRGFQITGDYWSVLSHCL